MQIINRTNSKDVKSVNKSSSHDTSKIYFYQGSEITFLNGADVMINATQMAKAFGKLPAGWLRTKQSEEYIRTLSAMRNCIPTDLVEVINGGVNYGTWMHQDVAIEFARWLSPAFAIWTNDRIKELLTQGVATIANDDEAILHAMQVLQQRVKDNQQKLEEEKSRRRAIEMQKNVLEGQKEILEKENDTLAPKAQYTDEVLQSTSTFTTNQIAQGLGLTAIALNKKLKDLGVQYYQSRQWLLTAKYKDKGYTKTRVYTYVNRKTDNIETSQTMVWTEMGRMFIHSLRGDGKL